MDVRNAAIEFDKITARDISDTQRRGMCMAAAMTFGLAYELWAKIALESGYGDSAPDSAPEPAPKAAPAVKAAPAAKKEVTEADFREAALAKGFTTHAIDGLIGIIKGDFAKGVATVGKKSASEVEALNAKFAPEGSEEQW